MRISVLVDQTSDLDSIRERKGHWSEWFDAHVIDELRKQGHDVRIVRFGPHLDETLATLRRQAPEVVFNLAMSALNDRGKDAYPAVVLELAGLAYTGTGPRGLLLSGDKALSKTLLQAHGIDVPEFHVMDGRRAVARPSRYPVLVKALNLGGSEGLAPSSLVRDFQSLRREVRRIVDAFNCAAICEEYIEGREISLGLLGSERPRTLIPGEWHFGRGPQFVTERLKWDLAYGDRCGATFGPAKLSDSIARRLSAVCQKAYRLLELRDYGSFDLRLAADGRIVVLEANANPGLFPTSGRWKPVRFSRLIAGIVRAARRRRPTLSQGEI